MLFLRERPLVSNSVNGERNGFSFLFSAWSLRKPVKMICLDNGRIIAVTLVEVDVAADAKDRTRARLLPHTKSSGVGSFSHTIVSDPDRITFAELL